MLLRFLRCESYSSQYDLKGVVYKFLKNALPVRGPFKNNNNNNNKQNFNLPLKVSAVLPVLMTSDCWGLWLAASPRDWWTWHHQWGAVAALEFQRRVNFFSSVLKAPSPQLAEHFLKLMDNPFNNGKNMLEVSWLPESSWYIHLTHPCKPSSLRWVVNICLFVFSCMD